MKRILSFVLSVVLSVSLFTTTLPAALAEGGFSLRNGIEFGDSEETVKQKVDELKYIGESKQITELAKLPHMYFESTWAKHEPDDGVWYSGTIAGYNDSECGFYFKNDKLVSMDYTFFPKEENLVNDYVNLRESLTRKYGDPLGNKDGSCFIITGPAFDRMRKVVYSIANREDYDADYLSYDEWIVDEDGYNVKVDLIAYAIRVNTAYSRGDYYYETFYYIDISYHYYTDADYTAAVRAKRDKEQAERDKEQAERDARDGDL